MRQRRTLRLIHALDKNRTATGSVVQMMQAVEGLAARGHQVWVAARPGGDLEDAAHRVGARFFPVGFRNPFDLASALRLRRLFKRVKPHIVHVHKGRPHAVSLMAATGLGRFPRIVVNRGVSFPLDLFNRWKYLHPRVDAVVCVAEAVRQVVLESSHLPPEKVKVIYAGTDVKRFSPEAADGTKIRRQLGLDDKTPLVGTVSCRDWKGWKEVLEAAAGVEAHLHVLVVGCEQHHIEPVLLKASQLGMEGRVHVWGKRDDMPDILAACDLVVDASWKGTGITGTIREAMAVGRPVVATSVAGNPELVVDGECGLLVPPRDIEALRVAMLRILGDKEFAHRLARNARRRVTRLFSSERRVKLLEELYLSLVS